MATSPTMARFIADLKAASTEIEKATLRLQYEAATLILGQVQANIKANFGPDGATPERSAITQRGYGATARRGGRGGGLFQSAMLAYEGQAIAVTVGGPGVPYAALQEQGGTVRPVNARYLTIPFSPAYGGTRAREHDLRFQRGVRTGVPGFETISAALVRRGARPGPGGRYGADDIAFILARKATIPARPYFQPAVDLVVRGPALRQKLAALLGRSRFGVVVS